MNPRPLVGAPAPKATESGRFKLLPPPVPPVPIPGGCGKFDVVKGLLPTTGVPVKIERPPVVVPSKPSCVPMSCANERDADTTRASISTCCDFCPTGGASCQSSG